MCPAPKTKTQKREGSVAMVWGCYEVGSFRLTANSTTNVRRYWLAWGTYVFYAEVHTALLLWLYQTHWQISSDTMFIQHFNEYKHHSLEWRSHDCVLQSFIASLVSDYSPFSRIPLASKNPLSFFLKLLLFYMPVQKWFLLSPLNMYGFFPPWTKWFFLSPLNM